MPLTVEPALIALGGVVVGSLASGGVQVWVTRQKNNHEVALVTRQETREDAEAQRVAAQERRAAMRLVRDEFTFAWSLIDSMHPPDLPSRSMIDPFATRLSAVWEAERRVLALELDPVDWNWVSAAATLAVVALEMPSAGTLEEARESLSKAIRVIERAAGGDLEPVQGLD